MIGQAEAALVHACAEARPWELLERSGCCCFFLNLLSWLVTQAAIQISQNLLDQNRLLTGSIVHDMWASLTSAHLT